MCQIPPGKGVWPPPPQLPAGGRRRGRPRSGNGPFKPGRMALAGPPDLPYSSYRMASTGSMREAFRAGSQVARSATRVMAPATVPNVAGSTGSTP